MRFLCPLVLPPPNKTMSRVCLFCSQFILRISISATMKHALLRWWPGVGPTFSLIRWYTFSDAMIEQHVLATILRMMTPVSCANIVEATANTTWNKRCRSVRYAFYGGTRLNGWLRWCWFWTRRCSLRLRVNVDKLLIS